MGTDSRKILTECRGKPKDEYGNIWLGIDNNNFSLWNNILYRIVPKIFGPIMIPTNPDVVSVILSLHKVGEKSLFSGNMSTDTIGSLVGTTNIFSAATKEIHTNHRLFFKEWISWTSSREFLRAVSDWRFTLKPDMDLPVDELVDDFVAYTLISILIIPDPSLVEHIKILKNYFVETSSCKRFLTRYSPFYISAYNKVSREIVSAIDINDSYPKFLSQTLEKEEISQHIISLIMVGYENLRSCLISLLYELALHPETELEIDDSDFIDFTKSGTKEHEFFYDALSQVPPVWLQARKTGTDIVVTLEDKTFKIPPGTWIFIHNEMFPERSPKIFSQGPNSCPGQYLAKMAAGAFIGFILDIYELEIIEPGELVAGISLMRKGLKIKFTEKY